MQGLPSVQDSAEESQVSAAWGIASCPQHPYLLVAASHLIRNNSDFPAGFKTSSLKTTKLETKNF